MCTTGAFVSGGGPGHLVSDVASQALVNDDHCRSPEAGFSVKGSAERHVRINGTDLVGSVELVQEIAGLRRRMETQPTIEQAKGLLIGFYGIDAEAAFAVLRRWSQHTNVKLHVLATALVAAASQVSEQPYASLRLFLAQLQEQALTPSRKESIADSGPGGSVGVPPEPGPGSTTSSRMILAR